MLTRSGGWWVVHMRYVAYPLHQWHPLQAQARHRSGDKAGRSPTADNLQRVASELDRLRGGFDSEGSTNSSPLGFYHEPDSSQPRPVPSHKPRSGGATRTRRGGGVRKGQGASDVFASAGNGAGSRRGRGELR